MPSYPGLGDRIRSLRQEREFTIEQLADRIGITWQSLQRIEKDKTMPDLHRLDDIAEALGTTIDFLIPRKDSPPPEEADKVFLRQRGFDDTNAQEILDFMEFVKNKKRKKDQK